MESVVFELAEGLNQEDFEADVLCANVRNTTTCEYLNTQHDPQQIYSVTRVASLGKLLSTSMAPAMLRAVRKLAPKYNIIHVHLPDPLTNLALRAAKPDAKIVVHWHSDIVQQRIALRAYAPLQEWLLRRADAVVATSDAYWRASRWLAPYADKVAVIPIGIRDVRTSVDAEKVKSIRARFRGQKIVFSLGRMVYYKGFSHLVAAAASLPDDVAVVIGGAGELLQALKRQVEVAGLQHRVHFVGRLNEGDMLAYHAAADVYCMSSDARSEAFGVVLLEAMAMGRPIVATEIDGSGVPWVNQHGVTGFNVPPAHPEALAAALRQILDNSELAEAMGARGRMRYEETFSSSRMVSATTRLYRSLFSH